MNSRNLKNSELDAIGRKLIERGSSRTAEVEDIISKPDLFSLVQARITEESTDPAATPFAGAAISLFLRRNGLALSGAAVLVIAVIASANFLKAPKSSIAASEVPHPVTVTPVAARPEVILPPQPEDRNPNQGRAQDRELNYEKAVVRQPKNVEPRQPRKYASSEPDPDFYAVSYAGEPEDAAAGQRIIRVNVKRYSLFAMGINVPLENDDEVVKADLLVGSDGVTRAIRVIK